MIIDPNSQTKLPNMKMVKRGFNQTPSDIRDKINFERQRQIFKNKENMNQNLSMESKIQGLNKINKEG